MLSPGDATLVAGDRDLPGLALLLDDDALADRLGAPVRRRYLRYKPGVTCTLALDVAGHRAFAVAYSTRAASKLDKTVLGAREGSLLAVDRAIGVVVARPSADRDLPALARLTRDLPRALARVLPGTDLTGAVLTPLTHKPQRRWVGLLTPGAGAPAVVRVHRPRDAPATIASARALGTGPPSTPWTPTLLGADVRRGLVAVTWLPGTGLHEMLAAGTATPDHLRAAGAALAALHGRPPGDLPVRGPAEEAADVRRAAAAVARVLPRLGDRARALADRLVAVLGEDRPVPVTVHGDFSTDQVVVGADGRTGLVDLDAVGAAEAALDVGSAVAALHTAAVLGTGPADVGPSARALLDGYHLPVDEARVRAHVAAGLLRRSVEPFRLCSPRWPEQLVELLDLAERHAPGRPR